MGSLLQRAPTLSDMNFVHSLGRYCNWKIDRKRMPSGVAPLLFPATTEALATARLMLEERKREATHNGRGGARLWATKWMEWFRAKMEEIYMNQSMWSMLQTSLIWQKQRSYLEMNNVCTSSWICPVTRIMGTVGKPQCSGMISKLWRLFIEGQYQNMTVSHCENNACSCGGERAAAAFLWFFCRRGRVNGSLLPLLFSAWQQEGHWVELSAPLCFVSG